MAGDFTGSASSCKPLRTVQVQLERSPHVNSLLSQWQTSLAFRNSVVGQSASVSEAFSADQTFTVQDVGSVSLSYKCKSDSASDSNS